MPIPKGKDREITMGSKAAGALDHKILKHTLPEGPGVYVFMDSSGRAIYVGKAKSLRKRVLSYFRPSADLPYKTSIMMRRASGLEFIITTTEKEAFILESNLIKRFMPRYNVILRDDKQYPCLRLSMEEPYPRLNIVRKIKKDGALYFGPFSSAHSVRSTLKVIDRVFRLRKCKSSGLPKRKRPCLNHQMGLCLGPCTYHVPVSEYRAVVKQVRLFLEGRNQELISRLKKDMAGAAGRLDFEMAAGIRDRIRALETTVEHQHVVSSRMEDQDIIGLAQKKDLYQVVILFVRKGRVVGNRSYTLKNPGGTSTEVMEAFLKQYYSNEAFVPKEILISEPVEDLASITERLCDVAGKRLVIQRPQRGKKYQLVKMAVKNAENLFADQSGFREEDMMRSVQAALNLKRTPRFIEGIDISNLHGDMAVGTVVSFVDGMPHRSAYRNYRIKEVKGIDDYGMMAELISRRLAKGDPPDLILVDGGKGHLSAVKRVLDSMTGQDIPEVVSIAKPDGERLEKYDKIYITGRKNPVTLRPDNPVLLLMMRIRDEAHRRAIAYHRRLMGKALTESELDHIVGVGAARKKLLIRHFKDIDAIAEASLDDLSGVPGISRTVAESAFSFFQAKKKEKSNEGGNVA
jgi:excinuclease ABC subunit C